MAQTEEERGYDQGKRAALRQVLAHVFRELGLKDADSEGRSAAWVLEREEAIARLREICAEHGDNDWDESLHLADIIEKHLGRYLEGA